MSLGAASSDNRDYSLYVGGSTTSGYKARINGNLSVVDIIETSDKRLKKTSRILKRLASLITWISYFIYRGHGWITVADGSGFQISCEVVENMNNQVFPMVFSFACLTDRFTYDIDTCYMESDNVGVKSTLVSELQLLPNPADRYFSIELPYKGNLELFIFDISG